VAASRTGVSRADLGPAPLSARSFHARSSRASSRGLGGAPGPGHAAERRLRLRAAPGPRSLKGSSGSVDAGAASPAPSLPRSLAPPAAPPPSIPLVWVFASKRDLQAVADSASHVDSAPMLAYARLAGLSPDPDPRASAIAGLAALRLDRRVSARQVARCLAAAQLNPACVPSVYPRTRALRLELLLRACVHFHASAEFVQAAVAADTAASKRHAGALARAILPSVTNILQMASALTRICMAAEEQRVARADGSSGPEGLLLDDRFVACCREGLHHAVLAGASLSSSMLEMGSPPAQPLQLATTSLRLFGLATPWGDGVGAPPADARRGRSRRQAGVRDALRLDFALACARKAAGLALIATGRLRHGKQQLLGARMLFQAPTSSAYSPVATASVLTALGLVAASEGRRGEALKCLRSAMDGFRTGSSRQADPGPATASASESAHRAEGGDGAGSMPGAAAALAYELAAAQGSGRERSARRTGLLTESRRWQGEVRKLQSRLVRALGATTVVAAAVTAHASRAPGTAGSTSARHHHAALSSRAGSAPSDPPAGESTPTPPLTAPVPGLAHSDASHSAAARHVALWIPPGMAPAGNIALIPLPVPRSGRRSVEELPQASMGAAQTARGALAGGHPLHASASRLRNASPRPGVLAHAAVRARVPALDAAAAGSGTLPLTVADGAATKALSSTEAAVRNAGRSGVGGDHRSLQLDNQRRLNAQQRRSRYAEQVRALRKSTDTDASLHKRS